MLYIGILVSRILEKNDQGEMIPQIVKKVTSHDTSGNPWKSHLDIVRFVQDTAQNNDSMIVVMYPPIIDIKEGSYPLCEQKLNREYFDELDTTHKRLVIKELLSIDIEPEDPLPDIKPVDGYYTMYIPEIYRVRITWPTSLDQIDNTVKGMMSGSLSYDELRILRVHESLIELVAKGFMSLK